LNCRQASEQAKKAVDRSPLDAKQANDKATSDTRMNPSAYEWKPSVAAPSWSPGGAAPAPAVPTIAQPPAAAAPAEDPEVDESDPLWQVVLKEVAGGDRARAIALINNPDSLLEYPAVQAALASMPSVEEVTEDMQDMAVTDDAASPATGDAMQEDEAVVVPKVAVKEGDPREHLNLVFIGHVDAGKSTLSGNILYLTDNIDKRTIERYQREAIELNRESWFLAFIMDTDPNERSKGKTVEVGKAFFETDVKRYTILDAPGHKNYVPNMIQGASQADVGILVISARKGEFEAGFDRGGQSREHAMLAKTLGVSYLVVAINKMDEPTVKWSKERYDECVSKLRPFLKSCGFIIKREVKFIPISGLNGANVMTEVDSSECSWWNKSHTSGENNTSSPTLVSLLDELVISGRDATAPLRVPILDRYSDRGTIAMGKVESGVIRPGMKVTIMPTRNVYKVDEVWANEDAVTGARPGENVLVKLNGAKVEDIRRGYVLCSTPPCRAVDKLICQIDVIELPDNTKLMTAGFQCMFHAHTAEEECTVLKIFETTNRRGQVIKGAPYVTVKMRAVVMLELGQTVCVETAEDMTFLGRFTLRTEGKTVAVGSIIKLPPRKE
jgi:peptide chain release factor subunit 3